MKIALIDIDGVLNHYPQCWIDYINDQLKTDFRTLEQCKKEILPNTYADLKRQYRNSDYKANLPVKDDGASLVLRLKQRGYDVFLVTSRPISDPNYPNLLPLTERWLRKNSISYREIIEKKSLRMSLDSLLKRNTIKKVVCVDDDMEDLVKMMDVLEGFNVLQCAYFNYSR